MVPPNPTGLLLPCRRFCLAVLVSLALLSLPASAQPPRAPGPDIDRATVASLPAIVLPEGFQIAGRRARLVQLTGQTQWFVVFPEAFTDNQASNPTDQQSPEPSSNTPMPAQPTDPFGQPIEVLPCKWLAAMTKVVNNQIDLSVEFRIWGEITTYKKRNYILPTKVATEGLFGRDARSKQTQDPPSSATAPLRPGQKVARDSQPQQQKDAPAIPDELPDRLRQMLLAIPRTRPLALPGDTERIAQPGTPTTSKPNAASTKPTGDAPPTLPVPPSPPGAPVDKDLAGMQNNATQAPYREGYAIVDRVGRLQFNRQAQTWTLLLEADDPTVHEPPLVLHPCRRLEVVEKNTQGAKEQIMFRVSGHVTNHQGQNYLLLRKLLMVYDLGNILK